MSTILGININAKNKKDAKSMINRTLSSKIKKTLFTPNPEIIMAARNDNRIASVINSADISIPDGIGVLIASRVLGEDIEERVTGIDTAEYVLSECAKLGYKVFLLGAIDGVADKAKHMLEERYEGLVICGTHHGYFNKSGEENERVITAIETAKADVLFVCFGSPMQEKWIFENRHRLKHPMLIAGLGGCLDVWAGKVKRAPRIFQVLYLEWLWRMLIEPTRIKRLFRVFGFFLAVVGEKCKIIGKRSQKQQ